MHSKSYEIIINRPIGEVFAATLDPKNTPLWIDGVEEEQSSEHPAKLGTRYRNRGKTGGWSEYSITAYDRNKTFTLSKNDGSYHVKYDFEQLDAARTLFRYSEWEDEGILENPMPEEAIKKLKSLIESQK